MIMNKIEKAHNFVDNKIREIAECVDNNKAVNALSGGVDSSVVTMLGHRALGERCLTYFIDNGLMRKNEPQSVVELFEILGINVQLVDASNIFFAALKGLTDPEEKREKGITQPFYKEVFGPLVRQSGAKYLLHGTNKTDVEETVDGIKRQHNIFVQLGIDPEKEFGYKIIEPLVDLRKDEIRNIAELLGLPKEICRRQPFPGPALACRVIGEVTREKIVLIREATAIVEEELRHTYSSHYGIPLFQYLAILHEDRVTGISSERGKSKRNFGYQIEVRCWDSIDARTAEPTQLFWSKLRTIERKIRESLPEVISITYNITPKPPSTIEAI